MHFLSLPMNATETANRITRDALLKQLTEFEGLPAMAGSVSHVVRLASSEQDSIHRLASFLLDDVALTQKILRLANTVTYRSFGGPVSTISRAIVVVGFDTIKTSAVAMILADGMKDRKGQSVRNELTLALSASVIGREMGRRTHFRDPEEVAISALFKNIGRLLVAAYDHDLHSKIARLHETGGLSQRQASVEVLGSSFETIADGVLRAWGIPDSIIFALAPLHASVLRPPRTRAQWMQQVTTFSAALAGALPTMTDPGRDAPSKALLSRFGAALELDAGTLATLVSAVVAETGILSTHAEHTFIEDGQAGSGNIAEEEQHGPQVPTGDVPAAVLIPALAMIPAAAGDQDSPPTDVKPAIQSDPFADMVMHSPAPVESAEHFASGKPAQAKMMLMTGAQAMMQMMASRRCTINELATLALRTLHESMGFRYATVCLRDVKTGLYKSRTALGTASELLPPNFSFAVHGDKDIFHLAMKNDADLFISDATSPKIVDLLPAWHREMLPETRSFMLLPLAVKGAPIGYFYADRDLPAPEGITPEETTLIKMIKGQVVALMNAR